MFTKEAGVGLVIGMIILAVNLKSVKYADVKKPVQAEDMSLGQIFGMYFYRH